MATFGRGFYVLDDYSAFREMTAQSMSQEAELYPLRTAYQYEERTNQRVVGGNTASPNPPLSSFTYSVGSAFSGNLVLTVADDAGKQVRRIDVPEGAGVHRVAWNLTGDPAAAPAGGRAGGGGAGGGGRGGRGGGNGASLAPGRYTATLGKMNGDQVTAVGKPQVFLIVPLSEK
jgi:hypothetical protein